VKRTAGISIPIPLPGMSYFESLWLLCGGPGTTLDAIRQAIERDKTALVEILRSDRPLGKQDRGFIADYLEGKFNRKSGRPKFASIPRNATEREPHLVRAYAQIVMKFKSELRKRGRLYGKADEAVDKVIAYGKNLGLPTPAPEQVRAILRNGGRTRKKSAAKSPE
jgi:hypothetical protein